MLKFPIAGKRLKLPSLKIRMNELDHIREWLDILSKEPDGYIKISEVYHSIRRMIGDE